MALEFGKAIPVITGFDLASPTPVDNRYAVATIADRDAHVTAGRAYAGMLCFVEATGIVYKYNGTKWVDITQSKITVSGDMTGEVTINGSEDEKSLALTLSDVVEAGTACKVTFNAKGQVTGTESLVYADIPNLDLAKITDAGTAAAKNAGTAAGEVLLIGADGKIDTSVLPDLAISQVHVVASEAEMLALTAQTGDVAVRSDIEKSFMLKDNDPTKAESWIELKSPTDLVQSVNGKTGTVVLSTTDIAEGSNLYYTEDRATANFTTNFKLAKSTDLADTADLVYVGDAIAATCITEDADHRFVTDADKANWNSAIHITLSDKTEDAAALQAGDYLYLIEAEEAVEP